MVGKLDIKQIFRNKKQKSDVQNPVRTSIISFLNELLNSIPDSSLNNDEEVKEVVSDILNGKKEE